MRGEMIINQTSPFMQPSQHRHNHKNAMQAGRQKKKEKM